MQIGPVRLQVTETRRRISHNPDAESRVLPSIKRLIVGLFPHSLRGMALVSADGAVEPVPDDAVASADAFVVRRRQVRAAVDTLARALGPHGATYLRNVQKWESALVPAAPKLAALPQSVKNAGGRLPATPPELHSARDPRRRLR